MNDTDDGAGCDDNGGDDVCDVMIMMLMMMDTDG